MINSSITIIISTYNRAEYIGECIDSILNQTVPPTQVIVVDDGSTDSTQDVLKQYGNKITYIKKENGGKASAINLALKKVTSKHLMFFDDDDIMAANGIELLYGALKSHADYDLAFGITKPFSITPENPGKVTLHHLPPNPPDDDLYYHLLESCIISLNSVLFKTALLNKTGPFDENLIRSQDYDFILRLFMKRKWVYVDETIFFFREHNGIRGSASEKITSSDVNLAWNKFDTIIGKKLLQTLPLSAYAHSSISNMPETLINRACFLQRAHIMETKHNVTQALLDMSNAMISNKGEPLEACEINSILGTFSCPSIRKYFAMSANNRQELYSIIKTSHNTEIKYTILKRLYWNFMSSNKLEDALYNLKFLLAVIIIIFFRENK